MVGSFVNRQLRNYCTPEMTRERARKNKASIFNASFSTGVADIRERDLTCLRKVQLEPSV
jgi:hypothetical protein